MGESAQSLLVAELARATVQELAPQELPLFRAQSSAYFENPNRALRITGSRNQSLGFGSGDEVQLLTPFVLTITTQVVVVLAKEVSKTAAKDAAGVLYDRVKMLFRRFRTADSPASKAPPPLTPAQLKEVREVAYRTARELKLPEEQAELMVNSLVGGLVVGSS